VAEIVPFVGGLVVGVVAGYRVAGWHRRLVPLVAAAVLVGAFASWMSGELAESSVFLAIDIPGSLLSAVAAALTVDRFGWSVSAQRRFDR
jgi:hypothetical protein